MPSFNAPSTSNIQARTAAEFVAKVRSRVYAITGPEIPPGDGASVPFAGWPFAWAVPSTVYKAYLDGRHPDAFRLHDFLYSEQAAAAGVSRADADLVLFLELQDDPTNAALVYAAVRLGGASHFRAGLQSLTFDVPPMWLRDP